MYLIRFFTEDRNMSVGGGTPRAEALLEERRRVIRNALKSEFLRKKYNPANYTAEGGDVRSIWLFELSKLSTIYHIQEWYLTLPFRDGIQCSSATETTSSQPSETSWSSICFSLSQWSPSPRSVSVRLTPLTSSKYSSLLNKSFQLSILSRDLAEGKIPYNHPARRMIWFQQ